MAINPGIDASGNGNNWAVNNINYSGSGSTFDIMTDSPTPASATVGNYCVLNPIAPGDYFASGQTSLTLTSANLNYGTGGRNAFGTIAVSSGKYYWEMSNTSNTASAVTLFGLVTVAPRASVYGVYYNSSNGNKGLGTLNSGASETSYGASWTDNDVIGVALDMDAATPTVTFYKNNTSQGAISVSSFVGQSVMAWIQNGANSGNMSGWANFGQRPFTYTPPTGYVRLQTYNLPTPTIGASSTTLAKNYENVVTYTGTGTSGLAITGLGFKPDLVWIKQRNAVVWHNLQDSVRGSGKSLFSNDTSAEYNDVGTRQVQFDSDGFTLIGSSPSNSDINQNGGSYVAWCWRANQGTNVTNTAGSITSTVSANTTSGFSVVTYTGTGANATVGHGLGVAPKMIIVKSRSAVNDWPVYHASLGASYLMKLNTTDSVYGPNSVYWNGTTPTSTVFSLGTSINNTSSATFVAYCFAEKTGFSKFGSYTGNGSTDGTFVALPFKPAFIMVKGYTGTSADTTRWLMLDDARNPYNAVDAWLYANLSNAEATLPYIDFLSNGFKFRDNNLHINQSGISYIYMAFAENPFNYSLAR